MIALVIALAYINKSAYYLVAVLGGFGFGAFIDELGKFITGDNDYFYRPTVSLIYVVFILLYLVMENFVNKPRLSEQEKLINVLEIAKEVVLEDLDHRERRRALDLLKECSPSDPVTKALRELLYATQSVPVPRPDIYTAAKYRGRRIYRKLVQKTWFVKAVIAFFILQSLFALGLDFFLLYVKLEWMVDLHTIFPSLSLFDLAGLLSATLAAALVIAAAIKMQKQPAAVLPALQGRRLGADLSGAGIPLLQGSVSRSPGIGGQHLRSFRALLYDPTGEGGQWHQRLTLLLLFPCALFELKPSRLSVLDSYLMA